MIDTAEGYLTVCTQMSRTPLLIGRDMLSKIGDSKLWEQEQIKISVTKLGGDELMSLVQDTAELEEEEISNMIRVELTQN